ncbi:transcription elongation regulator [Favolaschia claudopus]|uniref:Transcription factor BYE1 n=1 Tax=Favolaschia claudopus TaxID=2862362 RepID=A0AAW0AGS5_9AGAR
MSTRLRTRTTSSAANPKPVSKSHPTPAKSKRSDNVENDRPKTLLKAKSTSNGKRVKSPNPAVYCLCKKGDDGSPMVNCAECDDWFHFACVDLNDQTAEDINVYVCPPCSQKTGHRTVMLWEGPEAVEDVGFSSRSSNPKQPAVKKEKIDKAPFDEPESADDDPSSEDDYVMDRGQGTSSQRRRARRLSFSDESGGSDSDSEVSGRAKRKSPGAKNLKRKAAASSHSHSKAHAPPPKRKRGESTTSASGLGPGASEDPIREFCLKKFTDMFHDIFLRYPYVRDEQGIPKEKVQMDLSEEENAQVEEAAKQFANELEQCVYGIYSEPDKRGSPSAGPKYKERFRMLQFNLSKVDRTVLHKRIASGDITAKEISLMSSTDLANEQAKQAIRMAEKEALEHSILEKTDIPRAKLTHKGLEDIEGLGETSMIREREVDRRREEEERRERERAARARQRTTSVSVPPESPMSPVTPMSASWQRPPMHTPLLPTSSVDITMVAADTSAEPEMNLADLINIDDELPAAQESPSSPVPPASAPAPNFDFQASSPIPGFGRALSPEAPPTASPTASATGISPFASKSSGPSFDLSALWAAPKKEDMEDADTSVSASATTSSPPQTHSPVPMDESRDNKDETVDMDITEDQDFDMFLDEKESGGPPSTEVLQAAFENTAQVWSGRINMPLDSTIPQETPVVARQIGGRTIDSTSSLWKTLFPTDLLRIDGRVPVDKSAQFLLQTRMNSAKELVAVAFSPGSSTANAGFQILMDFLIAKGRHGLVFPWGSRPKDHHPGKELYIIPLLSSDKLPDYMELLDNFVLPKTRSANYLVGVWILNKGKLASPPPVPAATGPAIAHPLNMLTPPSVTPTPQLTFEPSVLAAEVAALTPEQVRVMLQSLTASTLNTIPATNTQSPIPGVMPMTQPGGMPPPQGWGHPGMPPPGHDHGPRMPPHGPAPIPGMGYPPPYPPTHQQHSPPYGQQPPQSSYQRRDYGRDQQQGYDRGGRDNSWGNERGGRGRGRGRGGGRGGPPPPADSGWPRRHNNGSQRRWD